MEPVAKVLSELNEAMARSNRSDIKTDLKGMAENCLRELRIKYDEIASKQGVDSIAAKNTNSYVLVWFYFMLFNTHRDDFLYILQNIKPIFYSHAFFLDLRNYEINANKHKTADLIEDRLHKLTNALQICDFNSFSMILELLRQDFTSKTEIKGKFSNTYFDFINIFMNLHGICKQFNYVMNKEATSLREASELATIISGYLSVIN